MRDFIKVRDVSKTYLRTADSVEALRAVTMAVGEGEIVAVVGLSGCGKTTLLRILAGIVPASAGDVTIDRRSPTAYRRQEGVGFVFQRPVLFPWRNVFQNTLLPTELGGGNHQDGSPRRARHLLEMMGLREFENAYPGQLSGGMLQRAAVARALVLRPQLLLLDEPFGALDEITREQLWIDFANMWREERPTVVLVTHSVREAVFLGQRVLVMSPRPGHIRSEHNVDSPPVKDLAFTGSDRFNEICGRVRAELV